MRSGLAVVDSPHGCRLTCLLQRLKPVLVQALIAKHTIETFDVCVLRRAARLDQDVLDAVLLRPGHECPASELRLVVRPDRFGVATKQSGPIKLTGTRTPIRLIFLRFLMDRPSAV